MAKSKAPEVIVLSSDQLEQLLVKLAALLPEDIYQMVETLLQTLQWIMAVVEKKNITLARLRRVVFGVKTEKSSNLPTKTGLAQANPQKENPKKQTKGHGRTSATDYPGAKRIPVSHPTLHIADLCPKCLRGRLYFLQVPARIVRIMAQPIFQATIFELERLRCALCGALFTAPAPPEAGSQKYDPSVGVMLNLHRYGQGQPMYRTQKWQNYFGVPLAASTQWELMVGASETPAIIYQAIIIFAAQGQLFHNDDTPMRVQSVRKEISQDQNKDKRTGIFTTNIIAQVDTVRVALFFTGQKHAGENLNHVLKSRQSQLREPLQMCDALSRNEPEEFQTILCHCIIHARRNFVDVFESFPEECSRVTESLREVYHLDAQTKDQKLTDRDRLAFHQKNSQPIMEQLQSWMQEQLDQKRVEPNSGLGEAIQYMLKRWDTLTRFLSVPGAPLDNNIAEQALKTAILHRKNSLSYKTLNGARIGDIHMSIIHTCQLNSVNPFDYLMVLQKHAKSVQKTPAEWLPWNYLNVVKTTETG